MKLCACRGLQLLLVRRAMFWHPLPRKLLFYYSLISMLSLLFNRISSAMPPSLPLRPPLPPWWGTHRPITDNFMKVWRVFHNRFNLVHSVTTWSFLLVRAHVRWNQIGPRGTLVDSRSVSLYSLSAQLRLAGFKNE